MLTACRTKYWNQRTCLFTYNAKSNLLFMQAISYHERARYQDRLIRLAVSYRSRFSIPWKCIRLPARTNRWTVEVPNRQVSPNRDELNSESSDECGHSFSSVRFYVLFNSLFRVLFNFPSRYLFAIGLVIIFSFGTSLRPTLA